MPKKKNIFQKVGFDVVSFDSRGGDCQTGDLQSDIVRILAGRPVTGPPLVTVAEAAQILRVSISSLNKWRASGGGPPFTYVGTRVRYRLSHLAAYLESRTRTSTSEARPLDGLPNIEKRDP